MKKINGIRIVIACLLLLHSFHSSWAQTIKNAQTGYDFSFEACLPVKPVCIKWNTVIIILR
jgi:hypothetical protein